MLVFEILFHYIKEFETSFILWMKIFWGLSIIKNDCIHVDTDFCGEQQIAGVGNNNAIDYQMRHIFIVIGNHK